MRWRRAGPLHIDPILLREHRHVCRPLLLCLQHRCHTISGQRLARRRVSGPWAATASKEREIGNALAMALWHRRPAAGLIHHSDRGIARVRCRLHPWPLASAGAPEPSPGLHVIGSLAIERVHCTATLVGSRRGGARADEPDPYAVALSAVASALRTSVREPYGNLTRSIR